MKDPTSPITAKIPNKILTGIPVLLSMSGNIEPIIVKTKINKANTPDTQANENNTTDKTAAVSIPNAICDLRLAIGFLEFVVIPIPRLER